MGRISSSSEFALRENHEFRNYSINSCSINTFSTSIKSIHPPGNVVDYFHNKKHWFHKLEFTTFKLILRQTNISTRLNCILISAIFRSRRTIRIERGCHTKNSAQSTGAIQNSISFTKSLAKISANFS